jgi:LysM repeat protein
MYLLWSTCVFGLLAFFSYLITDSASSSSTTTIAASTTSTSISPTNTAAPLKYTVLPGESLFGIAAKMKVSAPALVALNKIKNPDRVDVGTVLLLPPATGFVPIGATTTMQP